MSGFKVILKTIAETVLVFNGFKILSGQSV
jgi:hypothetical protein